MNRLDIDKETTQLLESARQTYGNKNQILVCMEELNELACVLAKYPRYDSEAKAKEELYEKVLDEAADVTIILEHVIEIFNISDNALDDRIHKKLDRLKRWLSHSSNMQETIDDRTVTSEKLNDLCVGCIRCIHPITWQEYVSYCTPCKQAQATEGVAPFHSA